MDQSRKRIRMKTKKFIQPQTKKFIQPQSSMFIGNVGQSLIKMFFAITDIIDIKSNPLTAQAFAKFGRVGIF